MYVKIKMENVLLLQFVLLYKKNVLLLQFVLLYKKNVLVIFSGMDLSDKIQNKRAGHACQRNTRNDCRMFNKVQR